MSDNHTVNLIRALIENIEGTDNNWESLTIIVSSFEGTFNSAAGYAYSPNGTISAVSADPWKVIPSVDEYISDYYKPGDTLPVKFLVQFDRVSGKYNITFEDTDEMRWKITPQNIKTLREELRPNFEVTNEAPNTTGNDNE